MPESKIKNKKLNIKNKSSVNGVRVVRAVRGRTKPASKTVSLSVPVYSLVGTKKGTVSLPSEIFGAKINKPLIVQAVRVYLINQRQGTASTKSRGEVRASTRKIWRQKGTGRARHGAISAPIFIGGGIAFGPKPRNFELKLSKQMKKKALFSVLSDKQANQKVFVVDTSGANGATKEVYGVFKALGLIRKKAAESKILFVPGAKEEAKRAARNIEGLLVEPAHSLNTYNVLNSNALVIAKDAIATIATTFLKGARH